MAAVGQQRVRFVCTVWKVGGPTGYALPHVTVSMHLFVIVAPVRPGLCKPCGQRPTRACGWAGDGKAPLLMAVSHSNAVSSWACDHSLTMTGSCCGACRLRCANALCLREVAQAHCLWLGASGGVAFQHCRQNTVAAQGDGGAALQSCHGQPLCPASHQGARPRARRYP